MKKTTVLIVLCIICLAAVFSAGCTSQSKPATTPAATPVPAATTAAAAGTPAAAATQAPVTVATTSATGQYALGQADDKWEYYVNKNDVLLVTLDENPTTGYLWNLTVSPGLAIVSDHYIAPSGGQGVGVGGTHEWEVKATGIGSQKILAILKKPSDPTTGKETQWLTYITIGS